MINLEFETNGNKTTIQGKSKDKMSDIFKRLDSKLGKSIEDSFFLYNGKKIDKEATFESIATNIDKEKGKLTILVESSKIKEKKVKEKFSNYIICPYCREQVKMKINNYIIELNDCQEKDHSKKLFFNEFLETQILDETLIKCVKCKNDKSQTFENNFYICGQCKVNLCPLCVRSHKNEKHFVMDYSMKDFICKTHFESLNSYCKDCNKDLCIMCEKEHIKHNVQSYGVLMPDKDGLNCELKKLEENIEKFKNSIIEVEKILNEIKNNSDIYLKIAKNIVKNFNVKERNFSTLDNINNISNFSKIFIEDMDKIINEKEIAQKLNQLLIIYSKMSNKDYIEEEKKIKESPKYKEEEIKKEEKNEKPKEISDLFLYLNERYNEIIKGNPNIPYIDILRIFLDELKQKYDSELSKLQNFNNTKNVEFKNMKQEVNERRVLYNSSNCNMEKKEVQNKGINNFCPAALSNSFKTLEGLKDSFTPGNMSQSSSTQIQPQQSQINTYGADQYYQYDYQQNQQNNQYQQSPQNTIPPSVLPLVPPSIPQSVLPSIISSIPPSVPSSDSQEQKIDNGNEQNNHNNDQQYTGYTHNYPNNINYQQGNYQNNFYQNNSNYQNNNNNYYNN